MGKFRQVLMPWKKEARKKHRTKKDPPYILKVARGIPQSHLDRIIFTPNWELRSGWGRVTNRDVFFNILNRDEEYSWYYLAEIRANEFKKGENGKYVPRFAGSDPLY